MQSGSYADFTRTLAGRSKMARAPMKATFEVTRRCPLACAHCYNNLPVGDRSARTAELTTAEHARLLDELSSLGCLWLLYTGGEIFARPDFLEIYQHARRRGFLITLFTNGTQITSAIADTLGRERPFRVEITLYGHDRETYERVTGVPGSFDRCRRGIDLLLERGVPLALKAVALSINQHQIPDMQSFAESRGLPFKFDSLVNPRLDGAPAPLAIRLSPEECVVLDLTDQTRSVEWRSLADRVAARALPSAESLYHCNGGVSSFAVDPYGGMSICVLSEVERYDLRNGTVSEGWGHFLHAIRGRRQSRVTKCTRCQLRPMCGMCPATAQLENGDPEEPVDFLCRVAHLRAATMEQPVPEHGDCEYCAGGSRHHEISRGVGEVRERMSGKPAAMGRATGARLHLPVTNG